MIFVVSQEQLGAIIDQLRQFHQQHETDPDRAATLDQGFVGITLNMVLPKPSSGSGATSFKCPHCGNAIEVSK